MHTVTKRKAKQNHCRHQRNTQQNKREVVQLSVPGGGCGSDGGIRGESQACQCKPCEG